MILNYLKHNRVFRRAFALPLKWRGNFLNRKSRDFDLRYHRVVTGGVLCLRAANLDAECEMNACSDIATRILDEGVYEPDLSRLLTKYSDRCGVVVNVGANVGLFAVHIAKTFTHAAQVVAIEPNPEAFAFLQRNIERSGCSRKMSAHQLCAGRQTGAVRLSYIPGRPEYSSVGGVVHGSAEGSATVVAEVRCEPLDSITAGVGRVGLLLIDTEGAELEVLGGAERILERDRPIVIFECSDRLLRKFGGGSRELEAKLRASRYEVRDADCPSVRLQHPFEGEAIAWPLDSGAAGC